MGPDGQPRLSLPRTPGLTVPQCDTSFYRVYLCPYIGLLFRGEVSWDSFPVEWSFGMSQPIHYHPGSETTGVISNRESLSWLQILLYEVITITPIAYGDTEDVLLQRAPPTTGVCPLYIPIPIPRYEFASALANSYRPVSVRRPSH